jgi:hypothetical protein
MSEAKSAGTGGGGIGPQLFVVRVSDLVVLMIAVAVGTFFVGRYAMNRLAPSSSSIRRRRPWPWRRVEMPAEEYERWRRG